ncbi:Outer membrane protein assembly factor BamE, lipoprotein component of the BamABCDE complex [Insolitispirillum peregrinum]|uniref:Outer membrane protein assembly factor BamE, lipoprotein component of the BamABCDE complex n=2 Tax=Insolitispirillum peregrinum TaxID=80876 RepID=A0A1N7IIJ5_9PROT|nr:Outer membrane protein assembly factor BamE, lipoprotein component of the BamABCDE complex [Insolitispirillum peregrinum]
MHTMLRNLSVKALSLSALGLALATSGCMPYDPYYANPYAAGGALADKDEGPAMLANVDETSIKALIPVGTPKERVVQMLGAPLSTSALSNGKTAHVYSHTFTSYSRRFVDMQMLNVEYDASGKVSTTTLTKTHSTF